MSTFATGLSYPQGLAIDVSGNIYEADNGDQSSSSRRGIIYKFTPGGVKSSFLDVGQQVGINGLAFDDDGNLFAATYAGIYKIAPDGTPILFSSDTNGFGLAFDSDGNLYEARSGVRNIYKFTPDGTRTTFGTIGDGFQFAAGIAIDPSDNVFVSDNYNGTIYKFDPSGNRSVFVTGTSLPTFMTFAVPEPSGLVLAAIGVVGIFVFGRMR